MVEFAIVLLPLMYILIGIVNFGYAFYAYNSIKSASIEATRSFTHGTLTKNEAQSFVTSEVREFGGWFAYSYINDRSPTQAEMTIWASTDAFELIDFPYASLADYAPFVRFTHRTPVYNTNPYS